MGEILIPEISVRPLSVNTIHEGGFGRVYVVSSQAGDRYALKTLKWELGLDKDALIREAKRLAELAHHRNIAEVLGLYRSDGVPYIAMPYYAGSLAKEMATGKRLPTSHISELLVQIANGLAYLHDDAGILHLDVKPQNILINEGGTVLISDFGISAAFPRPTLDGVARELFMSGMVGTVAYMSPEHFTTRKLSPKADVFAVGVILFELLTGKHPFLEATLEHTVENILTLQPGFGVLDTARIPSELRTLCLRCLAKEPSRRPSAAEIATAVSHGLPAISGTASRPSPVDVPRLINKASTLSAAGRLDEARSILEECLQAHPYNLTAVNNLAEVLFSLGDVHSAAERAEQALATVQWFPAAKRSVGTLLTNLANYYLSIDPEKAIRLGRAAAQLDPHDWQALGNVAEGCRVLGEARGRHDVLNEGLDACRKAMDLNAHDLKLQVTYGGILLALGDQQALWPHVVNLVNIHGGDDVPLRLLLIRTLIAVGHLDEAEKWIGPMREHPQLSAVVAVADRELAQQRAR